MIYTTNKKIALSPPESKSVKISVQGGLARVEQYVKLAPYTVVLPSQNGPPVGSKVYLHGDSIKWHLPVHELDDGTKFILVDESQIIAFETLDAE